MGAYKAMSIYSQFYVIRTEEILARGRGTQPSSEGGSHCERKEIIGATSRRGHVRCSVVPPTTMQQQQWAGYSFYGAYPPTTPYPPHPQNLPPNTGAYPPFYPQHPPVDPAPFEFNAEAYTRQAKAQHRRTFTAPVPPPKQPLKPALKKAMTIFQSADNPLSRQRSNPQSTSQHMLSRQRTRSNPAPPDSVMTNPELSTCTSSSILRSTP